MGRAKIKGAVMALDVGQVLSKTFGNFKERFVPLLGMWAVYFGATILLYFVFALVAGGAMAGMATGGGMGGLAQA